MEELIIFILGCFGGGLRFLISSLIISYKLPWPNLFINLVGTFSLPIFKIYLVPRYRLVSIINKGISVGFIGSFTTFSGIMLDTFLLIKEHLLTFLIIYLITTIIGGHILTKIGEKLANRWITKYNFY